MRRFGIAIAASLALLASACGGSSSSSSGSSESGAAIAPAGTALFVSVSSDLDSSQWKTAQALLDKFPGHAKIVADLRASFEKDSKLDFENDVRPALGPEIDVIWLDLANKGSNLVAVTQPKDDAKFKAMIDKGNATGDTKLLTEKVGDWTAISDKQASLDAFKQASAGDKLADAQPFKDATGKLSGDAIVKAYANGAKVTDTLQQSFSQLGPALAAQGKLTWVSAELVAQDGGMKLDAYSKSENAPASSQGKPYTSELLSRVPADAVAFLTFRGGNSFDRLQQQSSQVPQQFQSFLGVAKSLGPIFKNETALYVRPGTPIPEITLLAKPDSAADGVAAVDKLVAALGLLGGGLKATPATIGGVKVERLDLGQFAILYGDAAGTFVVSTSERAFSQEGGDKLSDSSFFKDAAKSAGMPAATGGFVYLNLKDGIPLAESFAQLAGSGLSPDTIANLRPLRSFLAYATADGGEGSATAFLGIQ